MKKHVKGLVIFLVIFCMAAIVSAEDLTELEGTVSSINTISNTFVLNTEKGSLPISVRVMSRIMIDGERKPLAAVKSGSYAKGTYKNWNGKATVKEIVITAAK
ncbi:MAG: hypothetical protein IMF07_08660 [Proteobacteria bacterium]|nr:hypothetical protein [Pseudomonadota bacterium]